MTEVKKDHFVVTKILPIEDVKVGDVISTSDYVISNDNKFIQLEFKREEKEDHAIPLRPGIYTAKPTSSGLKLYDTEFTKDAILTSFSTTNEITGKIECFFNNLHIYKEYGYDVPKRAILLYGPPGCHAKGTEIIMFNGSVKNVEDIKVGEFVMGPDSKPREVLQLARNRQEMVRIIPTKGDEFIVNRDHILHLTPSVPEVLTTSSINMSFNDWLKQNANFRERYKLTRTGIEFDVKNLPVDPYILGLWLGDGSQDTIELTTIDPEIKSVWLDFATINNLEYRVDTKKTSDCVTIGLSSKEKTKGKNKVLNNFKELELINNKHIPMLYLTSHRNDRLKLLAGLIDSDGHNAGGCYDISTKLDSLRDGILYLARSLGFAAYNNTSYKKCQTGNGGFYHRITISGDLSEVPVLLERKKLENRKQIKNVLRTGFAYELLPEDNYYGFTLNGDHLYLTSDFTIHHNTGKTATITQAVTQFMGDDKTAVVIWKTDVVEPDDMKHMISHFEYIGVERLFFIAEDLGGVEAEDARMSSKSSLLSLLDNQEKTFKIPVVIIATTNFPEMFLANIANRPQRFDDKIKAGYPNAQERADLMKFLSKDKATEAVIKLIQDKKFEEFTPAHIKDSIIRSAIYSMDHCEVLLGMLKEIESYNKGYTDKRGMGFGQ